MEDREIVTIAEEVDRVYKNVPDSLTVNLGHGTVISLKKTGFKDTVVWNPWIDKAKAMADFGNDEVHFYCPVGIYFYKNAHPYAKYKNMVCVEVGSVAEPVVLGPGDSWAGSQTLTLL